MKLSQKIKNLSPSATLGVKARSKELQDQGIKIISLSAGEPDFETPQCVIEATKKALENSVSRYTAVRGTDDLIGAMQLKFKRDQKVIYNANQVLSTVGAKAALSLAFDSILDSGDEVIILKPYWVSYPDLVKLSGATPVFAEPHLESIFNLINSKTKIICLNSPNNPSGLILDKNFLIALMKKLENTDICVISDEIYEHLRFDHIEHISPASLSKDAYLRTLVISGVAKGYAMTGWRVGVAGGPEELINAMVKLQGQRYTCVAAVSQAAAAYALREPQELKSEIEKMRQAYEHRRNIFMEDIIKIDAVKCIKPQGAFYALPDFSQRYEDDIDLANNLLTQAHVATVAGSAFGAPGHLRISLASSLETIQEGLSLINKFLA